MTTGWGLGGAACKNSCTVAAAKVAYGDGLWIPDEAAAQDPQQPCSAPLGCQSSASGKQRHPRRPRLVRDHRHKSAMCHPPGLPPPPSQGRTPSVPGLRSHAPGRQRVVSPIPISHRRGSPILLEASQPVSGAPSRHSQVWPPQTPRSRRRSVNATRAPGGWKVCPYLPLHAPVRAACMRPFVGLTLLFVDHFPL
mgnify:CR=1 FL=1